MDIHVENVEDPTNIQSPVAAARSNPISHLALAPRFGIDQPNQQDENKLSEIYAYAQGVAKSEDIQDIIYEVMHLEGVLGAPRLGEARIDRLHRYCKLKRQEAQIREQIKDVSITGRVH